jgi:trehalose synthase-fused probable maltokinase
MNVLAESLDGPLATYLEHRILPGWLLQQRWLRSKSRVMRAVTLDVAVPLDATASVFAMLRIDFAGGAPERYALPLSLLPHDPDADLPEAAVLGSVTTPHGERMLVDACHVGDFRAGLFDLLSGKTDAGGSGGALRGHPASPGLPADTGHDSRVLSAEQSNTSFVYGSGDNAVFVKLYRRLEPGVHPEPEMLRFLRERTGFRGVPGFRSSLEWMPDGGTPATVALAQEFVAGENAWEYALANLRPVFARSGAEIPVDFTAWVARLGTCVGTLHAALGSRPDLPEFAPEPLTAADVEAVRARTRALLDEALPSLEKMAGGPPSEVASLAHAVLEGRSHLDSLLNGDGSAMTAGQKIRTHGDLHLGQILTAGEDVRILDFEGEPGRSLAEARVKQSPLRDTAGMLRSFHYAAHAAARDSGNSPGAGTVARVAESLCASFLPAYFSSQGEARVIPAEAHDRAGLLHILVLEKAVYELHYELNNRPDWVAIPLAGLAALCEVRNNR